MNTDVRTAGDSGTDRANSIHGSGLNLLLGVVMLATAGCSDMAPPAANANVGSQPALPAPGPTLHSVPPGGSQTTFPANPAAVLAAGTDETVVDPLPVRSEGDQRIVFLYRLHSPFGMALAMSHTPAPR